MGPTPLDVNATTDTLYRWNFFRLVKVWNKFSVVLVSCTEALLGSVKVTWYPRIMPSWQHSGTFCQEARSFVEPWWTTSKLSGGLDGSANVKWKSMVGEWEGRKMDEMKVKEIALNPFAPDYIHTGAHQMEPASPIQALSVNPFQSRFINRTVPWGGFPFSVNNNNNSNDKLCNTNLILLSILLQLQQVHRQ